MVYEGMSVFMGTCGGGITCGSNACCYSDRQGYQATSELDKIVLEFIENNEVDRVLSAEKGEAWLFSFQKGGDVGTMLKIGEQYLMLQPVSDQQAEAP